MFPRHGNVIRMKAKVESPDSKEIFGKIVKAVMLLCMMVT